MLLLCVSPWSISPWLLFPRGKNEVDQCSKDVNLGADDKHFSPFISVAIQVRFRVLGSIWLQKKCRFAASI